MFGLILELSLLINQHLENRKGDNWNLGHLSSAEAHGLKCGSGNGFSEQARLISPCLFHAT